MIGMLQYMLSVSVYSSFCTSDSYTQQISPDQISMSPWCGLPRAEPTLKLYTKFA